MTITKQTTREEMQDIPTKTLLERLNQERTRVGRDPLKSWSKSRAELISTLHTMLQTALEPTPSRRKAAKAAPKRIGGRRRFPDTAVITVLNLRDPKRRTGRNPYKLYSSGMTVAEALKAGIKRRDVNYDSLVGHIEVSEQNGHS